MRSELVTCALFFAENLCFGPNFMRPEGMHQKHVRPETSAEIAMVVFYLGLAECLELNPKHKTELGRRYSAENRLGFLRSHETETRQKLIFSHDYLKKELSKEFLKGCRL